MATMFPTPLPAAVTADAGREAERRVYHALARLLDPEHAVFYSVAWLTRATGPAARDGEADFVIAHSDLGVLVLEVKGGQIGHDQMTGEWHSTDRHDHRHPIRDPFAQATSSHHALEAKLKEHPVIRRFYIRIGHGVVFPDSANPHRPLTPNAEPAITVFAEDLDHIDACVRRMFDYWAGSMSRALAPAPGFVQAVTDLLAPRFELPRSLGATIKGDDRELLRLTEDQFRVLDHALAPAARGSFGWRRHGQDDARAGEGEAPGGRGARGPADVLQPAARRLPAADGWPMRAAHHRELPHPVLGHGKSGGQSVPGHVRGRSAAGLLRAHPAGGAPRRARQAASALRRNHRGRGAGLPRLVVGPAAALAVGPQTAGSSTSSTTTTRSSTAAPTRSRRACSRSRFGRTFATRAGSAR